MKKLVSIILTLTVIFCCCVPVMGLQKKITISSASATTSEVSVSGTTTGITAAIVIQVLDSSDNILTMETSTLNVSDGSFSHTVSVALTAGVNYKLRLADYDGSEWFTTSVTVPAEQTYSYDADSATTKKEEKFEFKFTDVKENDWFYDAVFWAAKNGITDGTTDTTFSPYAECTRAQIVRFLWNALSKPAAKADDTDFTDLDKSSWYYDAVLWAIENKVTNGKGSTATFKPNDICTRAEAMRFIWNYAGNAASKTASSKFIDVSSDDWFSDAVYWGYENKVTDGTSETTFSPEKTCTRAEIIQFLYNYIGKNSQTK